MSRLEDFRARKDALFAGEDHSPLTPEQKHFFKALTYFPENPDLALTLPVDETGAGAEITIHTTDAQTRIYHHAGTIDVPIGDEIATLTLLALPGESRLFLPFVDGTSGNESYKVGRYLEPQLRPDGRVSVDFNYAYNPYCAYGEGWSCPIPPDMNHITPRIEAGEKDFKG